MLGKTGKFGHSQASVNTLKLEPLTEVARNRDKLLGDLQSIEL